jgi:dephospho-CoA kinase
MAQQKIIGLTGLYCAGKNYAAAILERRGVPVLDVDKLGHEAIGAERDAIVRRFGTEVLGKDGTVDRRILGKKVFGKPEELSALEAIVHPAANALTGAWISRQTGLCAVNAALLHCSSAFNRLTALILVCAPLPVRFFRALKRDRLSPAALVSRFSSQNGFIPQYFSGKADIYTVNNSGFPGSERALEKRIDVILKGL